MITKAKKILTQFSYMGIDSEEEDVDVSSNFSRK